MQTIVLVLALCAPCGMYKYRVCATRMPWMCNQTWMASHAGDLIANYQDGLEGFGDGRKKLKVAPNNDME